MSHTNKTKIHNQTKNHNPKTNSEAKSMAASATAFPLKITASWDTQERLPYSPHRTYPKNPNTLTPAKLNMEQTLKSNSPDRNLLSVSTLLSRKAPNPSQGIILFHVFYLRISSNTWCASNK